MWTEQMEDRCESRCRRRGQGPADQGGGRGRRRRGGDHRGAPPPRGRPGAPGGRPGRREGRRDGSGAGLPDAPPAAHAQQLRRPAQRRRGRPGPPVPLVRRARPRRSSPRRSCSARSTAYRRGARRRADARGGMPWRDRGEVVDVRQDEDGLTVLLADGRELPADTVVLALGNPPPAPAGRVRALGRPPQPDPWAESPTGGRRARARGAAGGHRADHGRRRRADARGVPGTRFTAVSRHGPCPTAHKRGQHPAARHLPPGGGIARHADRARAHPGPRGGGRRRRLARRGRLRTRLRQRPVGRPVPRGPGLVRAQRRPALGGGPAPHVAGDGGVRRPAARVRHAARRPGRRGRPRGVRPDRQLHRAGPGSDPGLEPARGHPARPRRAARSATGLGWPSTRTGGWSTRRAARTRASTRWARHAAAPSGRSPPSPTYVSRPPGWRRTCARRRD